MHKWRSEVSPPLPSCGATPGFPNHQTLKLTEEGNVSLQRRAWFERCCVVKTCRCPLSPAILTPLVGSHRQRPPLTIHLSSSAPTGLILRRGHSAAWRLSLGRVLQGFLPSLEAVALLLYPVYHIHHSDCALHSLEGSSRQVTAAAISDLREILVESAWCRSGKQNRGPGGSRIQDHVTETWAEQGTGILQRPLVSQG